jgi:hypothetical protein
MSMIGCFYSLKDEDLEAIIKNPKLIHCLWGGESEPVVAQNPSFFSRLFGAKPPPSLPEREDWKPSEKPVEFDVDKAWQGIHFLLTGSDWEGDGPLAFILHGGREILEEMGYGPPHGFTAKEVKEIDAARKAIDEAALYDRADPAELTKNEIYPQIWESEPKEECIGYLRDNLKGLKKFVAETAQSNRALIAYIG